MNCTILKSSFLTVALLALPVAALHASGDSPADAGLRRAMLQADAAIETETERATVETRLETDLADWLKIKNEPAMALDAPPMPAPEPANTPETPRRDLALPASSASGGAKGDSPMREKAFIHHDHHAKAPGRECDAHVPSAYLKYLSLRFHAGPPAIRA